MTNNLNNVGNAKGNLGDWRHASRLFISGDQRLAPKVPFLYHVYFTLGDRVREIAPDLVDKYNTEIGMLVSSADLPQYSATVEERKQYNRIRNVTTAIKYNDVSIDFHDDNFGVTTRLLEAYYRFMFADGANISSYTKFPNDRTYKGIARNQARFGLDNKLTTPFFKNIKITQLSRKTYTTFTLINPIIKDWQHPRVESGGTSTLKNTIRVAYEAVQYDRGFVDTSDQGDPVGFGATEHYDKTPSPISPPIIGDTVRNTTGIYDYITLKISNNFDPDVNNPNLNASISELDFTALRSSYSIGTIGVDNTPTNGLPDTVIPGGSTTAPTPATPTLSSSANTPTNRQLLESNPAALDAAARQAFFNQYQANGGAGGVNEMNAAYNSLSSADKQNLKNRILEAAN